MKLKRYSTDSIIGDTRKVQVRFVGKVTDKTAHSITMQVNIPGVEDYVRVSAPIGSVRASRVNIFDTVAGMGTAILKDGKIDVSDTTYVIKDAQGRQVA